MADGEEEGSPAAATLPPGLPWRVVPARWPALPAETEPRPARRVRGRPARLCLYFPVCHRWTADIDASYAQFPHPPVSTGVSCCTGAHWSAASATYRRRRGGGCDLRAAGVCAPLSALRGTSSRHVLQPLFFVAPTLMSPPCLLLLCGRCVLFQFFYDPDGATETIPFQ